MIASRMIRNANVRHPLLFLKTEDLAGSPSDGCFPVHLTLERPKRFKAISELSGAITGRRGRGEIDGQATEAAGPGGPRPQWRRLAFFRRKESKQNSKLGWMKPR